MRSINGRRAVAPCLWTLLGWHHGEGHRQHCDLKTDSIAMHTGAPVTTDAYPTSQEDPKPSRGFIWLINAVQLHSMRSGRLSI